MNTCNATRVYKIHPITNSRPITKIHARITPILARIDMSKAAQKLLQICNFASNLQHLPE